MHRGESGEGLHYTARGSEMWFKATVADTDGRFSLMERTLPPGGKMPPPHRHQGNEEAYFVLNGAVEFRLADEMFEGTPGTFVLVPAGESHTFANTSDAPTRLLVLHSPGLDHYFRDLELLWDSAEPPDRDAEVALMRRHGMESDYPDRHWSWTSKRKGVSSRKVTMDDAFIATPCLASHAGDSPRRAVDVRAHLRTSGLGDRENDDGETDDCEGDLQRC